MKYQGYIYTAIGLIIGQFLVFKTLYPSADFVLDSYGYIYSAMLNLDVSIRPIGYSKFLWGFHHLTHSDTVLVYVQYLAQEGAALYFFYTVLHLFEPHKFFRVLLFLFLFVNPAFLVVSNSVGCDALFIACSILWVTNLIWMFFRPRGYHVFTQAVLVFLAFTLRYNAICYPFITGMAFGLSGGGRWVRLVGIVLPFMLVGWFVFSTIRATEREYGVREFSAFGGWQLSNNALHMYPHIAVDSAALPSAECRVLDRMVREFLDTGGLTSPVYVHWRWKMADFYMWCPTSPMMIYQNRYVKDPFHKPFGEYIKAGPVFSRYGSYLIKHHSLPYIRYYLIPNIGEYFVPKLERLSVYNDNSPWVQPFAAQWFGYSTTQVSSVSPTIQGSILKPLPFLFGLCNLLYIVAFALVFRHRNPLFITVGVLVFSNFIFSIVAATPIVFRYEFFPMIVIVGFSIIMLSSFKKFTT